MSYIKGTYIKELFHNEMNGYTVGLLKIKETDVLELNKTNTIFFTGIFVNLRLQKNYTMQGNLISHTKYGNQFSVDTYQEKLPSKRAELVEFLSSDLFPIGEKTAEKIVELYKEETIKNIIDNPNCLLLVPRLSQQKIDRIHEVLLNYKSTSEIIINLNKMGFSNKVSLSLFNKYKNNLLTILNDNIYFFVEKDDLSFLDIDEIAKNNGMKSEDERRIKAVIVYVMEQLTFSSGDTYSFFDEIANGISKYCNIDNIKLEAIIIELNKMGKIKIIKDKYYLKKYYDSEVYISDRLCFLNDIPYKQKENLDKVILEEEKANDITYDNLQKEAIKKALSSNLTLITGGPGTGKTTIIKAIVNLFTEIYKAKESDIALLAPTGRAARRMMEATYLPAYTIHKYLGWDKESNVFTVNEYNPNLEKYIIVDEASMIDTILMSSLLKGIRRDVKLILVGDYYQLPSVGPGQVLKDLIDSEMLDVIKLNSIYRQNEESYIINLAYEIKNKDLSESFFDKKDDYNFIECSDTDVQNIISNIVAKAIEKGYNDKTIQIMSPMYKTLNGIDNLNIMLQDIFNKKDPSKNEVIVSDVIFREGDKILQLVNDTENNVSNGDIGYIVSIVNSSKSKSKKDEIIINYDGNKVTYTRDKFINIRHGYAISVHKSQGSEFKMVILPFVNSFKRMLYNKLIYTAVTRSKEKLILVGDKHAFIYGIKNDYVEARKTNLKEFILNKYNNL